jgi:RNA polymerase sigma factor (sigma-70 family)
MPEPEDHQLLAEFTESGAEPAFAAIVARYVNLVYSTAFRSTGNAQNAEEITQVVFIILARKAEKLSRRVVLSGWLYQTTRLTAANFMKGEFRRRRRENEAAMQSILNESPNDTWPEIAPLLDEAMGRLGQTDRDAVVLRYFENKSAAEIGAALRMNEETARRRVNRALEKLRKFFAKRGVNSAAATIAETISINSVHAAPVTLAKTVTVAAIAKGATASASTLTLIKGALKIMAWTKAKTAIVAGVVVLLVAGTATVGLKMAHAASALGKGQSDANALQGTWSGQEAGGPPGSSLTVQGSNLEFHGANPREWYKATVTFREDTVPKQLIAVITDCVAPEYVGKTSYAIYQIQGGTFTMVGNEPGNPNVPSSFDAPGGRKFVFTKK